MLTPGFSGRCTAVAAGLLLAFNVAANPTGATVTHGSATFANPDAATLVVSNTNGTIINWNSFSIGVSELTSFDQCPACRVLNRDIGGNISNILGAMSSPGTVYLINRNGIVFGAGSSIDVNGLVASTLDMTDDNFLNSVDHFTRDGPGAAIVSQGATFTAANGGRIWLLAGDVDTDAATTITTPDGHTVLAAGTEVQVVGSDLANISFTVTTDGSNDINALGDIAAERGVVGLYADNITTGSIDAGEIYITAETGDISVGDLSTEMGDIVLNAGSGTVIGGLGADVIVGGSGDITIDAGIGTGTGDISLTPTDVVIVDGDINLFASGIFLTGGAAIVVVQGFIPFSNSADTVVLTDSSLLANFSSLGNFNVNGIIVGGGIQIGHPNGVIGQGGSYLPITINTFNTLGSYPLIINQGLNAQVTNTIDGSVPPHGFNPNDTRFVPSGFVPASLVPTSTPTQFVVTDVKVTGIDQVFGREIGAIDAVRSSTNPAIPTFVNPRVPTVPSSRTAVIRHHVSAEALFPVRELTARARAEYFRQEAKMQLAGAADYDVWREQILAMSADELNHFLTELSVTPS